MSKALPTDESDYAGVQIVGFPDTVSLSIRLNAETIYANDIW
jgi:hypothetical protein